MYLQDSRDADVMLHAECVAYLFNNTGRFTRSSNCNCVTCLHLNYVVKMHTLTVFCTKVGSLYDDKDLRFESIEVAERLKFQ